MKRLFHIILIGLLACSAQASYLYWKVFQTDIDWVEAGGADDLQLAAFDAENINRIGDTTAYSFYIEVVNYENKGEIGLPKSFTYAQLSEGKGLCSSLAPVADNVWHGGGYPDP